MEWSLATRSVWGKLLPDGSAWMPLVRHLEDAALVAGYLWDHYVPEATKQFLGRSLGLVDEQTRALVAFLTATHDVGKVSPAFAAKAVQAPWVLDTMRDHGLDARPTREDRMAGHWIVGQIALEDWSKERWPTSSVRSRRSLACVVGCHHGSAPSGGEIGDARKRPYLLGDGAWQGVRTEILDKMLAHSGAEEALTIVLAARVPLPAQVLLTGLVIMADWIASNTNFFPFIDAPEGADRFESAIEGLRLPDRWQPDTASLEPADLLTNRFPALAGKPVRPLQARLVQLAREVERPGLFIVEGPMGVGKTEAALMAAEVLAERFAMGGVFVGLPTMATANPMFDRARDWLQRAVPGQEVSIALAHGKAALNDSYGDLIHKTWTGQVYDEAEALDLAAVIVNQWLRGRKRPGLSSIVVGTIDQSLFAALKAKHVVLRHLGIAGKVVIIDEVHAADDYMRQYLKRLLSWLGAYGSPVILMSATLPPAQRNELINAYAEGADSSPGHPTPETDQYPRISVYDGECRTICVSPGADTVDVRLHRISDDNAALGEALAARFSEGGCIAVVCNTVTRAQETFLALRERFGFDVTLAHSRFLAPHRASREAELVRRLGPGGDRPERLIVVGTQVLEQSLDVDFDLLVSDVAPMDLLLQRMGRLHRHPRRRPQPLATPEVWLRGVEDWAAVPPIPVRGSQAIYGRDRLLRALAVLAGREQVLLPQEIPTLVRLAYDADALPPIGWEDTWRADEERAETERLTAIAKASTFLLSDPGQHWTLNGFLQVDAGDPDRGEERGTSQVRDSGEGLEVIALTRRDGLLRLPEGIGPWSGRVIPDGQWGTESDERLAREMAKCTLRLPAIMCYPSAVGPVIEALEKQLDYAGWQQSRWISGQLAVVFDDMWSCRIADFILTYDPDQGLRVTHHKEAEA